jgi:hypothetical protein
VADLGIDERFRKAAEQGDPFAQFELAVGLDSIQAKLLKLFVQRPYPVWALDHVAWVGRINKDQGDPECECRRRLCSGIPEPMRGPAGYLAIIRMMRGGFPDIHWTLEEMVAEGDKVAARFIMRGAHRSTGGDRIPARPLVLNQGGQTFETSGTGLVRASFCG